ncbi:hypothetical protein [Marinobacterium aestuariivivens]|uniref:DUF4124 domain-containing protein n=1 Tax=Marinobacterium aestuariivivens TaxID=1698799 RepID=A0ABW1ZWF4_9GAMM
MCGCRLALLLACLALPLGASEVLQYEVTAADGFSRGAVKGSDVYEGKARGSLDNEPMHEVAPVGAPERLPAPAVIPFSNPPEVREVRIEKEALPAPLSGEDRVFEEIRQAPPLERCLMMDGEECDLEI